MQPGRDLHRSRPVHRRHRRRPGGFCGSVRSPSRQSSERHGRSPVSVVQAHSAEIIDPSRISEGRHDRRHWACDRQATSQCIRLQRHAFRDAGLPGWVVQAPEPLEQKVSGLRPQPPRLETRVLHGFQGADRAGETRGRPKAAAIATSGWSITSPLSWAFHSSPLTIVSGRFAPQGCPARSPAHTWPEPERAMADGALAATVWKRSSVRSRLPVTAAKYRNQANHHGLSEPLASQRLRAKDPCRSLRVEFATKRR
jgi:hypothetical protein